MSSNTMPPAQSVSTTSTDPIPENRGSQTGTEHGNQSVGNAEKRMQELGIENTNIKTAAGVTLNDTQKVAVGSILDLFAGRPSLQKLSLWSDNAVFADPITNAEGRKQYAPQWYGLQTAFSSIERLSYEVKSAGNPIEMDLSTNYTVKGLGMQKKIDSLVRIYLGEGAEEGKIVKVEDRWNGELPEGVIAKAFRNLNSVTVPAFVGVPKNSEEDAKRGN